MRGTKHHSPGGVKRRITKGRERGVRATERAWGVGQAGGLEKYTSYPFGAQGGGRIP